MNPREPRESECLLRRDFLRASAAGLAATAMPAGAADFARAIEAMRPPPKPRGFPSMWVGGVTDRSAIVKAKLRPGTAASLLVLPPGGKPRSVPPQPATDPDSHVTTFLLRELEPDNRYSCTLEVNGTPSTFPLAEVHTFPPEGRPASFSFAFGSCARTGSEHEVFDAIRLKDPAFFLHLGDLHYANISRNDPRFFRAAWDTVLSSAMQGTLYRTIPLAYVWDDHDFGPNDGDHRSPSRAMARRVYREYAPHYPLAAAGSDAPVQQAFTCGRARFILTDLRSERSPAARAQGPWKTMMGSAQKEWFKQELAESAKTHAIVFWASSVPWIGAPAPEDGWQGYVHERREIAEFIARSGIRNLAILCGDAHMLAADDGTNSDYSGAGLRIPVMHGSPLDQRGSFKGGPYSQGFYTPSGGQGCFGLVKVTDDGRRVAVEFTGRDDLDQEKVRLDFAV